MGVHNPREDQYVDLRGFGAQQGAGAGVRRCARGQDVIDQDDAAAGDVCPALGGHLECALNIAGPLGRDNPICCSVGRMRLSASEASLTPLCREITRASAPD